MFDSFNREINYLRLSISSRCQWHCLYCRPKKEESDKEPVFELNLDQILKISRFAVETYGMKKIRLTGGEPLLHPHIISIVKGISGLSGIKEVNITTNGLLLGPLAQRLKEAGLNRVNVSLDTLNPKRLAKLVQFDGPDPVSKAKTALDKILRGIAAANSVGIGPIKINSVSGPWTDNDDILAVRRFCANHGFKHQIIMQMNLEKKEFHPVLGGKGGHCDSCNRLRVTNEGRVLPCLMSDIGVDLPLLDLSDASLQDAFNEALMLKPKDGHSGHNSYSSFIQIGG